MPLDLLRLPYLIQEKICKEMNYSLLTVLSFCSLRVRKLIEFLNLTVPKLHYRSRKLFIWCGIQSHNGIKKVLHARQNSDLLIADTEEISLGGAKFHARFSSIIDKHGDIHYIIDVPRIGNTIQRKMQKHMNSLFHYSGSNAFVLDLHLYSRRMPGLRNVSDSFIRGKNIEMKTLEDYFTKHPNHHSANIEAVIDGKIPDDSKIWNIGRLCIRNQPAGRFLRRFTGEHLLLYDPQSEDSDLIYVLQEWTANRAYQNLKTLVIRSEEEHGMDWREIMAPFQLQRFEPTTSRRPTHITYNTEIINMKSCDIEVSNYAYYEMKRSDGRRAFFRCNPGYINFFVYDDPE